MLVTTANATFEGYTQLLEWAKADARDRLETSKGDEAMAALCEEEVRKQFAAAMVEAVVWIRPWLHSKEWGVDAVLERALADEGLTAAVMSHRSLMIDRIRRGLGGRIGVSRKEEAATA